ncbi:MAG TPA: methyltransferase domain-containing protein [Vicinamibacterales bacterium]|nr:methyltransferase domain-containing protein [Vicinamibacterales bacterium]
MTTTNITHSVYGQAYGGTAPENYQRYFVPVIGGPFAEDLVGDAALRPGERVLDVACGTGVVARLAAARVGPNGSVAALDLNPGMLAVARSIPAPGAPIRWYESPAESMPLPDAAFDVVLCQLGLQFMTDTLAALREMRRVLVPGGRVLASAPPPSTFFAVLDDALARHAGGEAAGFVRMVFSLGDPSAIERLFREAGFAGVSVRTYTKTLRLPAARDFLWQYVHCTPLTAMLAQLDAGRLAALEREVVRGWEPWSSPDGISYEQGMHVAEAHT